jgi:hypothetical protein
VRSTKHSLLKIECTIESHRKELEKVQLRFIRNQKFYTHPVGFVKPATLQAPFAGPDGYNS